MGHFSARVRYNTHPDRRTAKIEAEAKTVRNVEANLVRARVQLREMISVRRDRLAALEVDLREARARLVVLEGS